MAGLTCDRKLWQLLWDRNSAAPPDGMSALIMMMGSRFGELAHKLFPGAALIDVNVCNLQKAITDTHDAIESGASVILEAGFCYENSRILADVIQKQADGNWHLIEVKSSTRVKEEHIEDLAYQKWVMEQCGHSVSRCSVMHANTSGQWPDIKGLFRTVDVTTEVLAASESVAKNVAHMQPLTEEGCVAPDARVCFSKNCHLCAFKKTVCWKGIEGFTIYDVIHASKIPSLEAMGVLYVNDIPDSFELSGRDKKNVDRIKRLAIDIDKQSIDSMLDGLEYPIYFLDFESASVAVPLFEGNHPWEKLAFQYSLHVMEEDGTIQHIEYLHDKNSDPSRDVAQGLVRDISERGSIVVYYAPMEKGVLVQLKNQFPEYAISLQGMIDRLWDLQLIFKNYYRHWQFGSRSSIKIVLPTLLPDLSYKDLDIQEGGSASLAWIDMLESSDGESKTAMAQALKMYCERDTWAMVKLLELIKMQNVAIG